LQSGIGGQASGVCASALDLAPDGASIKSKPGRIVRNDNRMALEQAILTHFVSLTPQKHLVLISAVARHRNLTFSNSPCVLGNPAGRVFGP
jgi:hypothetical protein